MKKNGLFQVILCWLVMFAFIGETEKLNQTRGGLVEIDLDHIYNIDIEKGQSISYKLKLSSIGQGQALYIEAASPYYDPYQQPLVTVRSGDGSFQLFCSQQNNQYVGICSVKGQDLQIDQQYQIEIQCTQNCHIRLQAFLSQVYEIDFGHKIQINALKEMGTVEQIKIQIPPNISFSDICVVAKIQNLAEATQGVQMYLNVGGENATIPTEENYQYKAQSVWGDGVGVFLTTDQVQPGEWIKLYLIIGQGISLQLYTQAINGNKYQIILNTPYEDFTADKESKKYILDLDQYAQGDNPANEIANIQQKTIQITFIIYAGKPTIKVGFEQSLENYLQNFDMQGTVSYSITPELREKEGFKGKIYIQVSSLWSCDYYFEVYTMQNDFFELTDAISAINKLQAEKQVHNYIYEALMVVSPNDTNTVRSYRLNVQIMKGAAEVGVRRCSSLQRNGTLDCLLNNTDRLANPEVKSSFDKIQISVRKDWYSTELYFSYDAKNCELFRKYDEIQVYDCQFHIVIFQSDDSTERLYYAITLYENRQQAALKEGSLFKDFIYKDTYHYYTFDLPMLQNVDEVTFSITIISGDAGLMGTTQKKYKYMELSDAIAQDAISISWFNSLTFTKQQIATNFYLGVYAYQASEVALTVVVKRTGKQPNSDSNTTQQSNIFLSEGLSQQYTLKKGYDSVNFTFIPLTSKNFTVQIIEIEGEIQYHISKQNSDEQISCKNQFKAGQQKCTFEAVQKANYTVEVTTKNFDQLQTFSISYFKAESCKKFLFNLPQFVFLAPNTSQCSTFSITDLQKSLRIVDSFSTLDILSTNVTFKVVFNGQSNLEFTGRQKVIDSDELKNFCKSQVQDNCEMKITIQGDTALNAQFYYVVEQEGKEMALFDGIVRKVVDENMDQKTGKFFYYEVSSSTNSIKIFTTNKDNVGYYVGAKFVDEIKFTALTDDLYLPYRDASFNELNIHENVFETHLFPEKGTSMIKIEVEQFNKYCTSCVMLVSVFGLQEKSTQANIFEIEVTQAETFIYLGQQKKGFLSANEIYGYEISVNSNAQSLITIRDTRKQSEKEQNCFEASMMGMTTKKTYDLSLGYAVLAANTEEYEIYIENTGKQICSYQISYSSLRKPISVFNPYMPSALNLTDENTQYYLYYHRYQDNLQVLSYVKSGDVKIYANPVSQNNSIENLLNKNLEMYVYQSVVGDSYLQISSDDRHFCSNCYYVLAFKGDPAFQAQITIARGDQQIGLTTFGVLKQTLPAKQKENYGFYSIYDFNLTVAVLYGKLNVAVLSPSDQVIYNKTIQMSDQIQVPKPKNLPEDQYVDYFDENSHYKISVAAEKPSAYYLTVKRRNITFNVYEGIPVSLSVGSQSKAVEFVNTNVESDMISVLVEVKDQVEEGFLIKAMAEFKPENSTQIQTLNNPRIQQSENSYNFVFPAKKGTYFISFTASQQNDIMLIIAKNRLTHLMSSDLNLFIEGGIFQIYTPGHNIMVIIDSCAGELEVKASSNYTKIRDSNQDPSVESQVLLQHANYGGHYIITAENVQGEYFLQVMPKNPKEQVLYIISYYYYGQGDIMPYKKVDIDPEISYELTPDKIIFSLSPVKLLATKSSYKILPTYNLYISDSSQASMLDSKCGLDIGFSISQVTAGDNTQPIKFPIDFKTIAHEIGEETDIYYVSANVRVKFENVTFEGNYPPYIDLVYTKTQITQTHHKIGFKSESTDNIKFVLMWIIVPFIVAAVLFIFALKFCIKKYRQLYPDQLVEEDREWGESEGQMKDSQQGSHSIST